MRSPSQINDLSRLNSAPSNVEALLCRHFMHVLSSWSTIVNSKNGELIILLNPVKRKQKLKFKKFSQNVVNRVYSLIRHFWSPFLRKSPTEVEIRSRKLFRMDHSEYFCGSLRMMIFSIIS